MEEAEDPTEAEERLLSVVSVMSSSARETPACWRVSTLVIGVNTVSESPEEEEEEWTLVIRRGGLSEEEESKEEESEEEGEE